MTFKWGWSDHHLQVLILLEGLKISPQNPQNHRVDESWSSLIILGGTPLKTNGWNLWSYPLGSKESSLVLQTTDFWFQSHVSWLRGEVFLFQRFQMALGSSKKNWGGIRSLPPLNHWIVSKSWDPILHLPLTSPIVFGGKDWFASLLGLSSWYISPTRQGAPGS